MSAIGSPAAEARGFTLIEMLVVLAIAGLIAGLGWPRLQGEVTGAEQRGATAAVAAGLRTARAEAVLRQQPVTLSLNAGQHSIQIGGAAPIKLPASVRVTSDQAVQFYADGTSTGGAIAIRGERRTAQFNLSPATGLFVLVTS